MKKLFVAIVLMVISFGADAQLSATIAAFRAVVAADYACSTFHCRTKAIEAYETDSLYGLLSLVNARISSSGDLQGVLNTGHLATVAGGGDQMILDHGTTKIVMDGTQVNMLSDATGATQFNLWAPAGKPTLTLLSQGTFFTGSLNANSLSANRGYTMPNEGTGSGLASTLVLHTTQDPILVSSGGFQANHRSFSYSLSGAGLAADYTTGGIFWSDASSNSYLLGLNSGKGFIEFDDHSTGFAHQLTYNHPTANRIDTFPDKSGIIALISDITNSGLNFANTDLTATGNRVHDWAHHSFQMNRISDYCIADDNGLKIITFRSTPKTLFLGDSASQKGLLVDYSTGLVKNKYADIEVGSGLGSGKGIIDSISFFARDKTGATIAAIYNNSGQGTITLKDDASAYGTNIISGAATATRTNTTPDHDGIFATNDGNTYSSGAVGPVSTLVVTHGLTFTPTRVIFVPTDGPSGNILIGYWISAIGATTFQVNFATPFTGTLNGYWQAWP